MKIWLLLLTFLCFGVLSFSKSPPQQIDKYSYIMQALTRPYSNAYEQIRAKTESGYKRFQSILTSGLTHSDTSEDTASRSPRKISLTVRDNNVDMGEPVAIDEENEIDAHSRSLQANCVHGTEVSTSVNIYKCNNKEVTKSDYDAVDGDGCTVTATTKALCYCPYDYYGDRCDKTMEFSCEIERISHPVDCQNADSHAYVYEYSGVPPCHTVQTGDTVEFKTKAICTPLNTQYNFEGVKPNTNEVRQQPSAPTTFTYAISNDRMHVTQLNFHPVQKIAFTNWKKMSDTSLQYMTTLTQAQVAGDDEITISIPFKYPLTKAATAGRYYFELSISTSGAPKFSTKGYNGGYFEQAGYTEPAPSTKTSKTLVIVLPIVGAVLFLGLIIGYKFYRKRKEQREQASVVDNAPLVEDEQRTE